MWRSRDWHARGMLKVSGLRPVGVQEEKEKCIRSLGNLERRMELGEEENRRKGSAQSNP